MVDSVRIGKESLSVLSVVPIPASRVGRGRDDEQLLPAVHRAIFTPVDARAPFLAQWIAQELMPAPAQPDPSRANAYLAKPPTAFEGLNFRAMA
jgi:hypothetical protein